MPVRMRGECCAVCLKIITRNYGSRCKSRMCEIGEARIKDGDQDACACYSLIVQCDCVELLVLVEGASVIDQRDNGRARRRRRLVQNRFLLVQPLRLEANDKLDFSYIR